MHEDWMHDNSMHQAAELQFARAVEEFARWRAMPEPVRSPAPPWWWGTAFELREVKTRLPAAWCAILQLPDGATYADGTKVLLDSLADQTSLPRPGEFPGPTTHSDLV
jgi:hypothetical protein